MGSFDRSTQSPFATGLLPSADLWVSILIDFLLAAAVLIVDTLQVFKCGYTSGFQIGCILQQLWLDIIRDTSVEIMKTKF